jgi:site-specific DNA-methyltransferase (cytosine-N4-specific)
MHAGGMMYTTLNNRPRSSHAIATMSSTMTDDTIQVLANDALTGLKSLPDKAVQACLTSPPFYLLRRYGTSTIWPDGWEGELGHEAHPNDFVRHLLSVFDEVWRVLRDDGCLWVNLADTFNNKQGKKGTTNAPNGSNGRFAAGGKGYATALRQQPEFFKHYVPGIAHKSEMGVPFRFHLAMTDPDFRRFIGATDGPQWICRRTIIWAKSLVRIKSQEAEGNAMPEPTRDRTSRNYEFLFLFAKQPDYYFDRTAIDVPSRASMRDGVRANAGSVWETEYEVVSDTDSEADTVWRINPEASPYRHVAMWPRALVRQMLLPSTREGDIVLDPFAGSGTTGEVAVELRRKVILIESSESCREALADRVQRLEDRPIQQSFMSPDQ